MGQAACYLGDSQAEETAGSRGKCKGKFHGSRSNAAGVQVKHLGARAMVFEGNEWTGQK